MARIVKELEYAVRRNEILDVAQQLIYTRGYEQMSIQDILGALTISKGAFYHYFDSKQALLEAMIERTMAEMETILQPIVEDSSLPALAKLQRYFDTAGRWKSAHKDYLLEMMRVWYDDHNAIVRQKMFAEAVKHVTPLLNRIIRQGVQEGVFATPFPDQAGEIVLSLFQTLGDAFTAPLLLAPGADEFPPQRIAGTLAAYTDALERVLGAPPGSLHLIDAPVMQEWIDAAQARQRAPHHQEKAPAR